MGKCNQYITFNGTTEKALQYKQCGLPSRWEGQKDKTNLCYREMMFLKVGIMLKRASSWVSLHPILQIARWFCHMVGWIFWQCPHFNRLFYCNFKPTKILMWVLTAIRAKIIAFKVEAMSANIELTNSL